jgi:hypothetical protein
MFRKRPNGGVAHRGAAASPGAGQTPLWLAISDVEARPERPQAICQIQFGCATLAPYQPDSIHA